MANKLFEMWAKVKRDKGSDMPSYMAAALVPIYIMAPDDKSALKDAKAALTDSQFLLDEIEAPPREIPVNMWTAYLARVWPDHGGGFPKEAELPKLLEQKRVFFGPIAGTDPAKRRKH